MQSRAPIVGMIARTRFVSVSPQADLYDTYTLMRLGRFRSLPVAKHGTLLGVLRFQAILEACLEPLRGRGRWEIRDLASLRVERLTERDGPSIFPSSPIAQAAALLVAAGTGFLPVLDAPGADSRLVAIVTEGDLLRLAYDRYYGIDLARLD